MSRIRLILFLTILTLALATGLLIGVVGELRTIERAFTRVDVEREEAQ